MKNNTLRIAALSATLLAISCSQSLPFKTEILEYDGNKVARTHVFSDGVLSDAGKWKVDVQKSRISGEATDYDLTFTMEDGAIGSGGAAVQFEFDNWSTDNYVFAPCHIYGGNRFRILPIGYAPFIYDKSERPLDMPVTTTNIPHLSTDGSDSQIDFRTNSCSTPLAGFYDRTSKRGFFILTQQDTVLGNEAFFINEYPSEDRLTIRLSAPGVREHAYTMCNADNPSDDEGIALKKDDSIKMHFRVYDFACEDLMAYFDRFLSIRKNLSGQNEYRYLEPFSSISKTIFEHHFKDKWYEDEHFGYICNRPESDSPFGHLQLAWNGVPALSLMALVGTHPDDAEEMRRICRTFDSIEYMQRESGLFNGIMMKGEYIGDNFAESRQERDVAMIRRTAMTIYFSLQCFDLMKEQGHGNLIKDSWVECMRKASDALCNLFDRYGEFGQFVYACTGEIYTPNSTQGALAMGALAYAYRYFGDQRYIATAEKAGQFYYDRDLSKGYVGGGPPEILQAPDSESSAELAESYTALYEVTRDEKWLKYARDAAAYFSTWVISYDYDFPESSTLGRAGVKSTGAVWASVQNEHGAPGIYVLSGDFLLKLYRATGDTRYLELCRDMAHNVVQYTNTEGNHIQSEGGFGYCSERVNIGDWESEEGIGRIPMNDSNIAWENTTLFHITENPGIYVLADKGDISVFDHVRARIVSRSDDSVTLEIENPTYRDASVSVLAETSGHARGTSLGWNAFARWPRVEVPSGQSITATIDIQK